MLIQLRLLISQDALDDAPECVLSLAEIVLDGLGDELQQDGRGVKELEHADGLDVVLDYQEGDLTWEEQT